MVNMERELLKNYVETTVFYCYKNNQFINTVLTRIVGYPNLGTWALIRVFFNLKSQLNLKFLSKI